MKRLFQEIGTAAGIGLVLAAGCGVLCLLIALVMGKSPLELIRQVLLILGALLLLVSGVSMLMRQPFSNLQAWERRFQKLPLVYFLLILGVVFILCGGGLDCLLYL